MMHFIVFLPAITTLITTLLSRKIYNEAMCFYTMLQFKENIPNCFKEIKKIYKKTKKFILLIIVVQITQ